MYKAKLNSKEEWNIFSEQSKPHYYLNGLDENEPKKYPCVVAYFEKEDWNFIKPDLYYLFIYKEDFNE